MLNRRTLSVIAPCNRKHTFTIAGTPYTEGTGLICRIPLTTFPLHTLGFSPRDTSVGSLYSYLRFILIPFLRTQEINQIPHTRYSSYI